MSFNLFQLIGGPCGQHGPYTFYKAFKYSKNGVTRIVTLSEFFFVKLWTDSDLLCIGELQLLWGDKNSEQVLASLRLYFLPENTPEGRTDHGEVSERNSPRAREILICFWCYCQQHARQRIRALDTGPVPAVQLSRWIINDLNGNTYVFDFTSAAIISGVI